MSDFTERLARARGDDTDFHIEDHDPMVVSVESSSDPDEEYTIVPNIGFCNCPDRQYRGQPCRHILRMTDPDVPSDVADAVLSGIAHREDQLVEEREELEERLATIRQRQRVWSDAAAHFEDERKLGADHPTIEPEDVPDADGSDTYDPILGAQKVSKGARRDDAIGRIADTAE